MYYTIYLIRNKINNKQYIGQHKTNDIADNYMGSGTVIKQALKKYGKENFHKTILFLCDTFEEMNTLEKQIVNEDFILREDTYNIRLGGHDGSMNIKSIEKQKQTKKTWSELEKAKHHATYSLAQKGNTNAKGHIKTKEACLKMSKARKGSTISEEWKQNISKKYGKENPMYGRTGSKHPNSIRISLMNGSKVIKKFSSKKEAKNYFVENKMPFIPFFKNINEYITSGYSKTKPFIGWGLFEK